MSFIKRLSLISLLAFSVAMISLSLISPPSFAEDAVTTPPPASSEQQVQTTLPESCQNSPEECKELTVDKTYISAPKTGSYLTVVIIISGSLALIVSTLAGWRRHRRSKIFSQRI